MMTATTKSKLKNDDTYGNKNSKKIRKYLPHSSPRILVPCVELLSANLYERSITKRIINTKPEKGKDVRDNSRKANTIVRFQCAAGDTLEGRMKQKELPAANDSPMDAADPTTQPRAPYPLLQKCSSESRVESLHKGLSRSSSQQSSAAPSIRSNSASNAAPLSRTGLQHCKLHRSSTSAPSTPEGWWKDAPDSDLWNDSYQMGAYLCSNGRFSKLYMCFASDTGTEYTVKVVRKSRWSLSSFRSRSRATLATSKTGTPVDARRKQQRDIETTLANSSSPDLFAAASTSSQFSESFPASALLESPTSTDQPTANEDYYDGDSISLDHTRKPKRQSHYLNHHHHNELQEYALLKSLQHHASILQVQDLVEDSRHFYCVTEFYNPPEQSLHVYCNGRPLSETEAAPLFYQILSCINFCHQRHIIHCNLVRLLAIVVEVCENREPVCLFKLNFLFYF